MALDQVLRNVAEEVLTATQSLCADGTLSICVVDNAGNNIAETGPPRGLGSTALGHAAIHQPHSKELVGGVNVTSGTPHGDILALALALQIVARIEERLNRIFALAVAGHIPLHTASRIEEMEHNAIMEALVHTHGAITLAATHLGISRSTMYRRLKHFGIALKTPR
jgi:hypothetical protein